VTFAYDWNPPPSFFREMAKACRCCQTCGQPPCDGVLAGGMCDEYCHCRDDIAEFGYCNCDAAEEP
jgi:hypothetical protein